MRLLMLAAACAAASLATPALAQELAGSVEARDFERDTDGAAKRADLARDERIRESRRPKARARPRAAQPSEVTAGREVRDSKGAVVGTVEAASLAKAVIASPRGKVEVPLDSFGLDARGLMIGITKAEFDALVAQANAPGR